MNNPLHYVAVRLVLYALSLIPVPVVAAMTGWGVTIDGGAIIIQTEVLVAALFGAAAVTGGVFRQWGTR